MDVPHTMDFSRLKVLEEGRKKAIAESIRLGAEYRKLHDRKNALELRLENIDDRLKPIGFSFNDSHVTGQISNEHVRLLREERDAVRAELDALGADIEANQAAQVKAQEDATAANDLHARCKKFADEVRA